MASWHPHQERYVELFDPQAFERMKEEVMHGKKFEAGFRLSEVPVFMPDGFERQLLSATHFLIDQVQDPAFLANSKTAIPDQYRVPGEEGDRPRFLQFDFAIAEENGECVPKLIELQAFPSVFAYQYAVDRGYREYGLVPEGWTTLQDGISDEEFLELFREAVLGGHEPENVVLLEADPVKQHTAIDFAYTEDLTGIHTVCLSEVRKSGAELYYERDGKKIPIRRIYNRVIFDHLETAELESDFDLLDHADVEWAIHPNWYFRISKHSLPHLYGPYVPESTLLSDLSAIPDDLSEYVLKPLYSFAGSGVKLGPSREDVESCADPENTILQRKVKYAEVIATPFEPSKAELRMMIIWNDKPVVTQTLARVSRGAMSNVSKNQDHTWVGSSAAYYER
ncbi:MAG: hypothetical protein ACK4P3_02125 [Fimbriimonadaceae bacterium]